MRRDGGVLGLLSAYKGLKLLCLKLNLSFNERLLSAYKGLKLVITKDNEIIAGQFIKCL